MKREVFQYSLTGDYIRSYASAAEAYRDTGIHASNIIFCCRGIVCRAGQYQWRYASESKENIGALENRKCKSIRQYAKDGSYLATFESSLQIAKKFHFAASNIVHCCKGNIHLAYGYQWRYASETHGTDSIAPYQYENKRSSRQVNQYTLSGKYVQTYKSVVSAAAETGLSKDSIFRCCYNRHGTTGGFQWRYANESDANGIEAFARRRSTFRK